MPSPRVPLLTENETRTAAASVGSPEYVAVLNLNRALFHHPVQARDFVQYFWDLMYEGSLPPRLRELAILRIAWRTGSVYEWTQHWHLALGVGVGTDDLLTVRDPIPATSLEPGARAVLAAVDDVVDAGSVQPATWDALAAALPDHAQRVEAVLAITGWRMVASVLLSLEIPLEDGMEPWPPDGVAPHPPASTAGSGP